MFYNIAIMSSQLWAEFRNKLQQSISQQLSNYSTLFIPERVEDKKTEDELAATPNLPKAELVKRLRERGHPILLFGETLTEACERLKQVEMDAPDAVESQVSGISNDFK